MRSAVHALTSLALVLALAAAVAGLDATAATAAGGQAAVPNLTLPQGATTTPKSGAATIVPQVGKGGKTTGKTTTLPGNIKLPSNIQTAVRTAGTASSSSSDTSTLLVLALVAAVALLGGIAFVIVRDAHGILPAGDGPSNGRGSASNSPTQIRKRRARAKAARAQRKRNR
jgi:hypothetical protein